MTIAGHRLGRRRLASLVVASVLLATAALPVSASPTCPAQDDPLDGVTFGLTGLDPGVLTTTSSLFIEASVTNNGLTSVADLVVSVSLTTDPLEDRALLDPWEKGDLDRSSREVARRPVTTHSEVAALASETVFLAVPPSVLAFPPDTSGVYGLTVALEGPEGPIKTARTFVTWLDSEPTAIPLAVIVLASGSVERVDTLLDTVDRQEISFAVDPMMLSPTAIARLASLDTYLLPAYNVDLASLARAGSSGILDRALTEARLAAPPSLAFAPWLGVASNVDQAVLALASDRHVGAILSMPVFSTEALPLGGYDGQTPPGSAMVNGDASSTPILVPDTRLSSALIAGPSGNVTTPARVTAETALLSQENTAGNPVLVVLGPSWSIESDHRSAALSALVDSPWVRLTPIATVLDYTPPASVDLPSSTPSETDIPLSSLTSAGSSLRGLDALAMTVSDPSALSDPVIASLLSALSFDHRTDPLRRGTDIESALATIDGLRSSVSLPGSSTLNLISKSGNIPVTVTNDLSVDVTVTIVLESSSPILVVEGHPEVTLTAGSSEQVLIPVTAVSSGNVTARVSLTNAEGTRLTPVTEFSLRIRAQWGDAFTAVMIGLGLLLLLAGTLRTIRRGKSDTRQGPSPYPDEDA
ncbi:MAG: hypothetical protein JW722_07520 [Demequinaceae bacterium]|nr:hypothetical protein [Demequinaceae bacterium]